MYDNMKYLGRTLREWQTALHNAYSLGELYRAIQRGVKLEALTYGVNIFKEE